MVRIDKAVYLRIVVTINLLKLLEEIPCSFVHTFKTLSTKHAS
jgi:hypothetical protein